jgi:hypothetical protein
MLDDGDDSGDDSGDQSGYGANVDVNPPTSAEIAGNGTDTGAAQPSEGVGDNGVYQINYATNAQGQSYPYTSFQNPDGTYTYMNPDTGEQYGQGDSAVWNPNDPGNPSGNPAGTTTYPNGNPNLPYNAQTNSGEFAGTALPNNGGNPHPGNSGTNPVSGGNSGTTSGGSSTGSALPAVAQGAGAAAAAAIQAQEAQNALAFQQQMWQQQQANVAPYIQAGNTTTGQLMNGISNGTFGTPQTFTAPTLAQAEQMPGYQFAQQQGDLGILEGAAATGGNISGGTMQALSQYNQNLATTNYNTMYNQALAGYQANLAGNQQAYGQLYQPSTMGASAAAGLNITGSGVAANTGNIMSNIGNAYASGVTGVTNAATNYLAQQNANSGLTALAGGGPG